MFRRGGRGEPGSTRRGQAETGGAGRAGRRMGKQKKGRGRMLNVCRGAGAFRAAVPRRKGGPCYPPRPRGAENRRGQVQNGRRGRKHMQGAAGRTWLRGESGGSILGRVFDAPRHAGRMSACGWRDRTRPGAQERGPAGGGGWREAGGTGGRARAYEKAAGPKAGGVRSVFSFRAGYA